MKRIDVHVIFLVIMDVLLRMVTVVSLGERETAVDDSEVDSVTVNCTSSIESGSSMVEMLTH